MRFMGVVFRPNNEVLGQWPEPRAERKNHHHRSENVSYLVSSSCLVSLLRRSTVSSKSVPYCLVHE